MITEREPSLGTLLKDLADESRLLFRQEVELARTELAEKASLAARNAAWIAAGAVLACVGLLALIAAAAIGLAVALQAWGVTESIALWLGPLIVGALVLAVGTALVMRAVRTLKRASLAPRQTLDSMRENQQWLKNRLR